jgi:urease accessory protein
MRRAAGTATGTGTAGMGTEALSVANAARLAAWLSPSFPIGAFSYSHGLERAVEAGEVSGERTLAGWLGELLRSGSGRSEAVLFGCAFDAGLDRAALLEVAELAHALRPSAELALEASCQGEAFLAAVANAWPHPGLGALARWHAEAGVEPSLPVIAGAACRVHALPRDGSLALYLHAFFANLISAGVRLVPLGQAAGQRVVAALEPEILATAAGAAHATLADLGSACPAAEIYSMQHETQYTRLFRS